jgi:trimeric autotransporter adhesin
MKYLYLTSLFFLLVSLSYGQQKIRVHNAGNTMYAKELTSIDSIKLNNIYAKFKLTDAINTLDIQKTVIDSLTFTTSTVNLDKIYIIYNGTDTATIINPYANAGVNITANAGTVVVNAASGIDHLEYNILGSSADGSLTMTTDKDVNLVLNNLTLTNPTGAAFDILGGKTTTFLLTSGSTNTISDGVLSTRNGTITTDGPIVIDNTGSLTISSFVKHGINTAASLTILSGTVTVPSAVSDGFHSEGFTMNSGTATISSLGDGIDAGNGAIAISGGTINITSTSNDVKAIKTGTNTIAITGGTLNLNVSGAQSKGICANGNITIDNGTFAVNISGATILNASGSGFNPSHATAFKSDGIITVNGGTFNIQSLAAANGGKGFSATNEINITGGNITISTAGSGGNYTNISGIADSYSVAGFSSNNTISITGGILNLSNTGANGKGISADVAVTISGTAQINCTNSGSAGKGIKSDGNVTFAGGTTSINLSGATVLTASGSGFNPSYPTAVKATGLITVDSGTITIQGTASATGAKGFSADAGITINGGNTTITVAGNGANYNNITGVADSYSAAALSSNVAITINSGTITTTSSGTGGKGLKSDGTISIGTSTSSPTLNITTTGARFLVSGTNYCHPKTLAGVGAVTINNGTNTFNSTDDGIHSDTSVTVAGGNTIVNAISTTSSMGEGVESPLINFTGGVTNITASNDGINATYGTVSGGTEQNDNSNLNISGGIVIVAGKDAIDSNGNITITGGTTIVCGVTNSPEEGLDFNGVLNMNGGLVICAGSNSNMTKNFNATSTQRTMYLKSSAQLPATSIFHVENAAGTEMVTFKPKNAVYYFHFSSPNVAASTSYKVYFGGTYTGGNFVGGSSGWGLYNGGTYSTVGGTLKSTFTSSATSTLNTVTF